MKKKIRLILGFLITYIIFKIIGNWGWEQDFYTGLFIAFSILIYNIISAFRKIKEEDDREFENLSEKKKKSKIVIVFIASIIFTICLAPIFFYFIISTFKGVSIIIGSFFKLFRNPETNDILVIVIGGFQGMIFLTIALFSLVGIILSWDYAINLKRRYRHFEGDKLLIERKKKKLKIRLENSWKRIKNAFISSSLWFRKIVFKPINLIFNKRTIEEKQE